MSLLGEISATLEAAGIRHALIGASALAAYGVHRASADLDLFVADASCLKTDLWADLQSPSEKISSVRWSRASQAFLREAKASGRKFCKADSLPSVFNEPTSDGYGLAVTSGAGFRAAAAIHRVNRRP